VAISPQVPEHSRELIERRHLTFEILSDRGNEVGAARPAVACR
jgi:peroxiredoxin